MQGVLFWNYYVTYLSLLTHLIIHMALLSFWCNYSKLVLMYSFQVFCLHAYSWAIPDRRYAAWVKQLKPWFDFVSSINILFYMLGIFGGGYMYHSSPDGMI